MTETRGPSPGARRYPEHGVSIRPADSRYVAMRQEQELASSVQALIVEESGYPPVVYFPSADVRLDLLIATRSATTCPFKGEAAYFEHADSADGTDIAWTYPVVYDEVAALAGHIAFYAGQVDVSRQA